MKLLVLTSCTGEAVNNSRQLTMADLKRDANHLTRREKAELRCCAT
jgi:hypothetical protein